MRLLALPNTHFTYAPFFPLPTAAFAVIGASSHLSQKCQQYGIQSLCYHALPLCDQKADKPKPRQICKDECEYLESDICRTEYLMAKRHELIGKCLCYVECFLNDKQDASVT